MFSLVKATQKYCMVMILQGICIVTGRIYMILRYGTTVL